MSEHRMHEWRSYCQEHRRTDDCAYHRTRTQRFFERGLVLLGLLVLGLVLALLLRALNESRAPEPVELEAVTVGR